MFNRELFRPTDCVAGDRVRDLFRVRRQTQPAPAGRGRDRGGRDSRRRS